MRRLLSLALCGWLVLGLPANAGVINLNRDEVPEPGHSSLVSQGIFTPYRLVIIGGKLYSPNPPETAYDRLTLSSQLEVGLLPDVGLSFTLPYGMARQINGTTLGSGLADINFGLYWRLTHQERATWKARVHANTGAGTLLGHISEGVPSVGFDNSLRMELMPKFLYGLVNLNYLYHLRSTGLSASSDLPVVEWRGQRLQLNAGLEATLTPAVSALVEVLAQYDSPAEAQRQLVQESGATWIALAPGLTVAFTPTVAGQLSVVLPVARGGYQDSAWASVVTGLALQF